MSQESSFLRDMASIRDISDAQTHPLRIEVLRAGMANTDVVFPEDAHPEAFHLGAYDGDELIGVASFSPSECPFRAGAAAWQLRGMAVRATSQSSGVGGDLLRMAIARLRSDEVTVLWCNARDTAAAFYERLGFVMHGDGFRTVTTGLPHHVMVLDL